MRDRDPFAAIAEGLVSAERISGEGGALCYVALGDSFTAGKDCPPRERWADRLAESLSRAHSPFSYRNLAREGATSADVLEQAGPALQLEPDLVTVICGANDALLTVRPDVNRYAANFSATLDRLRAGVPGIAILTATSPEHWGFMELRPRTRTRVMRGIRRINEATREIAAARGVPCFDAASHPGLRERDNFAPDGLHPSPQGHERAAAELARVVRERFGIRITTGGGPRKEEV